MNLLDSKSVKELRVLLGIMFITGTLILVGWVAINENARMEEFTERTSGRSIERGALIFEDNCSTCHGHNGQGIVQRAPALNNPLLFGYQPFAELDAEKAEIEKQLDTEEDPEVLATLEARLGEIDAETLALEEAILYDWNDRKDILKAELDALEKSIEDEILPPIEEELGRTFTPQEISTAISLMDIKLAELLTERDSLQARKDEGKTLSQAEENRLVELNEEIAAMEARVEPLNTANQQRNDILAPRSRFLQVLGAHETVKALRVTIAEKQVALVELGEAPEEGDDPHEEERRALVEEISDLQTQLEEQMTLREDKYNALVENFDIAALDPHRPSRLVEVAWAGTRYDFIESTVTGGRPTSASYWPEPMAAWAQLTGGPLRADEIQYLVDFILNWDREFTLADLHTIEQFPIVPSAGGGGDEADLIASTDIVFIADGLQTRLDDGTIEPGDADKGRNLFTAKGCTGCHAETSGTGPARPGLWTRVQENQDNRLTVTGFEDNPEMYLIQSIALPNEFIVSPFGEGVMTQNFTSEQLTWQDLADILAYLKEQN